jgi:hypothetical protein
VDELLVATSAWTTREVLETIERALDGMSGPALRFGVGLRLFLAKAKTDPVWARFIACVWELGGLELPARDLEAGILAGVFRVPGVEGAHDVLSGGLRKALARIGFGGVPPDYADQVTEVFLRALGTDARRIASVLKTKLPPVGFTDARSSASRAAARNPGDVKRGVARATRR